MDGSRTVTGNIQNEHIIFFNTRIYQKKEKKKTQQNSLYQWRYIKVILKPIKRVPMPNMNDLCNKVKEYRA